MGHCVQDGQSLQGSAALCCRSVSWSKCETGKTPGVALEPVCNTSNLTSASVGKRGPHWLISYALTFAIFSFSRVTARTRCKDVHDVINNASSWSVKWDVEVSESCKCVLISKQLMEVNWNISQFSLFEKIKNKSPHCPQISIQKLHRDCHLLIRVLQCLRMPPLST